MVCVGLVRARKKTVSQILRDVVHADVPNHKLAMASSSLNVAGVCDLRLFQAIEANRKVVLNAVSERGSNLRYVDPLFKADKEVVMTAVKTNGLALSFADHALKADPDVALAAVKNNGYAFRYVGDRLKETIGLQLYVDFVRGFPVEGRVLRLLHTEKLDDLTLSVLDRIALEAADDVAALAKRVLNRFFDPTTGTRRKRDRESFERDFLATEC